MEIELLHVSLGDKKKTIDTTTEKGRQGAKSYIDKLLKQGTAIFVERKNKTYRLKGYDEDQDRLIVAVEKGGKQKLASTKINKAVAVAPVAGGL